MGTTPYQCANADQPTVLGPSANTPHPVKKDWGVLALLVLWAVPMMVIVSVLMVGHWVILPSPTADDQHLRQGIHAELALDDDHWHFVHVLYSKCRCSRRIFDYLFTRPSPPGVSEHVLLIDDHPDYARRARDAGFSVRVLTPEELRDRFNIEGAPLLLVVDPEGVVRYSGGYTSRKQGLDYQDIAVLDHLRANEAAEALPLYGCGVSKELQAMLDPIHIKYRD